MSAQVSVARRPSTLPSIWIMMLKLLRSLYRQAVMGSTKSVTKGPRGFAETEFDRRTDHQRLVDLVNLVEEELKLERQRQRARDLREMTNANMCPRNGSPRRAEARRRIYL